MSVTVWPEKRLNLFYRPKRVGDKTVWFFHLGVFHLVYFLQLVPLVGVSWLLIARYFPLWEQTNLRVGWLEIFGSFLMFHLGTCWAEHQLHVKIMHKSRRWFPLFHQFYISHDERHHGCTKVSRSQGKLVSEYAILRLAQTISATFTWWTLAAFWGILTPVFAICQWLMPDRPILLGGYAAIAWAYWLYEMTHAWHHKPDDWWRRQCARPRIGLVFFLVHGGHFVHHHHKRRNFTVGGFFLIPLADIVFGTLFMPMELLTTWLVGRDDPDWTKVTAPATFWEVFRKAIAGKPRLPKAKNGAR